MSVRRPKHLVFRWSTRRGLVAIILFLTVTTLAEYIVVLYATNLGVEDKTSLGWKLPFPGSQLTITLTISPLFHLVPAAVVVALTYSWTYLTNHLAVRRPKTRKEKTRSEVDRSGKRNFKKIERLTSRIRSFFGEVKARLLKIKGIAHLRQRIHFARATIISALTVLLLFGTLILVVSLSTYPKLIHWTVSGAYQSSPPLVEFVKSVGSLGTNIVAFLAPINWVCSSINTALLSIASGFRDFVASLGGLIQPLAELDNAQKYLLFQNVSAWASALAVLLYGAYRRQSYRYDKKRR
ncbi:hypothetical protein GTO27_09740 [Candidatus Bathyarchaeota archaeon]|nr:hypothetical protein [Candidatus Bathyarchaeota archaeon]